CMEPLEFPYTF
nr:immunoglobulin light chain junction region [Macaca mulatta]